MSNDVNTKSSSSTFLKGALIMSVGMIIVKLLGMLYKVVLTRMYYTTFGDFYAGIGTGLLGNAYEVYIPLFTLATAGFPIAVSRLISENIAKNRYNDVRRVHNISKPFFITMGIVCFSLMVGISFIYVGIIKSPYSIYSMMTLAPSIFFGCLVSIYRGYFEGQRNMFPTALSEVIEILTKVVVGLSLAYIVMKSGMSQYTDTGGFFGLSFSSENDAMCTLLGFSVAAAISGISVGSLFSYLTLLIMSKRKKYVIPEEYYENSVDALSKRETFVNLVKTAVPIGLAAIVMALSSTVDTMVIQNVLYSMAENNREGLLNQYREFHLDNLIPLRPTEKDPIEIHTFLYGCYGYALTIMQLVTTLTQAFGTSALPNVTGAYTKGDKKELKQSMETVLKLTMLVTFPSGFGLFALSYPILSIFYAGNSAVIGAHVLRIMGLAVIVIAASTPICSILQAVGKIRTPLILYLIAMAVKVVLNYAFVSIVSINIIGATMGSFIAYLFVCVAGMTVLLKRTQVKFDFSKVVIKPLLGGIVCAAAAWLSYFGLSLILPSPVATLFSIITAAVIYVICLVFMRTFTENDIEMLPKGKKIVTFLAKRNLLG